MSIFNEVIGYKPKKTAFNLNHEYRGTAKFGVLTPVLCREVLPSDKWKFSCETFTRFQPLLSPLMHRINAFEHYWFVPNRIIWKDWDKFISPRGVKDEVRPIMPHIKFDGFNELLSTTVVQKFVNALVGKFSLFDYLGINHRILSYTEIDNSTVEQLSAMLNTGISIQLLPLLAYQKIYTEYYADENLEDIDYINHAIETFSQAGEIKTSTLSADDMEELEETILAVRFRSYEKDYFTSALPNTQRGEDVTLGAMKLEHAYADVSGVKGTASVVDIDGNTNGQYALGAQKTTGQDSSLQAILSSNPSNVQTAIMRTTVNDNELAPIVDEDGNSPDLSPVTINELRRAVKLQEFLEKSMRGGYRLIEQIKAHFGVTSSDARLDIPQYLGGDMQKVIVNELSSMSSTEGASLGQFSGHATEIGKTKRRSFFSEEHGFIFCIYSVLPRTSYCQGVEKQWTRLDWLDYAWPEFAHLGEQEVWNQELFVQPRDIESGDGIEVISDYNKNVFGYQSRYAEYKTIPSSIHGSFRDNMDFWTLTRKWLNCPTLSKDFVNCIPDDENNTRAFTTTRSDEDYLTLDVYHSITCIRPLPKFGVPML